MYNLFKFEIYKLKYNRTFLVSIIIIFLLIADSIYLFFYSKNTLKILDVFFQGSEYGFLVNNFKDRLHVSPVEFFYSSFGFCPFIVIILVFMVESIVLEEFSSGTINNLIISGHKKENIYISKFLVMVLSAFLLTVFLLCGTMIAGIFINSFKKFVFFSDLIGLIGFIFLITLILSSLVSICMCLAVFIRNKAIFLITCMVLFIVLTILPNNFNTFMKNSPVFMLIEMGSFNIDPFSIVFSSISIITVTTIIGVIKFNKLDTG
ncbi:ABC transporter permease [Clostridium sp.]|jgi:ABC-type transport system involved in multi-copper enzyme maturation permease subunit|uniref:ABC transporter permease n=1 Tax=Clostridium sp. TaxID=1506 RepID=UPI0025C4B904|nr:ABC transporter permease subunit [Clostridium sp.]MCI2200424.1 ABC transporter permease [Clostridium sp.]